jgi:putative transposase
MAVRNYHVWFSTKYRQPALVDVIAETVETSFCEIASRASIDLMEVALEFDHVHLLLAIPEPIRIASAMHRLKGASAREVFLRYPQLRLDMGSNSFWQEGYGFRLVPEEQIEAVCRYIRTQSERPARRV